MYLQMLDGARGLVWSGSGRRLVAGYFEWGNESPGSVKCG